MFQKLFFIFILFFNIQITIAHNGWEAHAEDMFAVLGFQENKELRNWMKFISSDMIDQHNHNEFYTKLTDKHKWFKCKHRLLFHWGYNSEPWSPFLEQKVKKYSDYTALSNDSIKFILKNDLRMEQKRRNHLMNNETESLFGFAHSGKDARYANFFISIAYNIHLLGDYTSDNTDLDGLVSFSSLMGSIITSIRNLDNNTSKQLIKALNFVHKKGRNEQEKADLVLYFLKQNLPEFIQKADNGSIKRRLQKKGFLFRD